MILARNLHRLLSYLLSIGLIYMALTGGIWAILYRWFYYEKWSVKWLITWHQGDIGNNDPTGQYIRAPFCIFITIGTFVLFFTGLMQFSLQSLLRNRNLSRRIHHWLALIAGLPLVVLAGTGGSWAVAKYDTFFLETHHFRYYLGIPKEQIKWLIWLHQGWYESLFSYFPPTIAFMILFLAGSGVSLLYLEYLKWSEGKKQK